MSLPLAPSGIYHSPRGTGVDVHASIFRDNRMAVDVPGSPPGGVDIGGGGCTADVMAFFQFTEVTHLIHSPAVSEKAFPIIGHTSATLWQFNLPIEHGHGNSEFSK